jgi:hypothetical protein
MEFEWDAKRSTISSSTVSYLSTQRGCFSTLIESTVKTAAVIIAKNAALLLAGSKGGYSQSPTHGAERCSV